MKRKIPKFISKIGLLYPTAKSKRRYTYGLYECPFCKNEFKAIITNVEKGITNSCRCKLSRVRLDQSIYNPGVYQILNTLNNKIYVGSTVKLHNRRKTHFSKLILGYGANSNLQKEFILFGSKHFKFSVLEFVVRPEDCKSTLEFRKILNVFEQKWIDKLRPEYNILKIAGSGKGLIHKKEAVAKIIKAQSIAITQYDLSGNFIKEWTSSTEAADKLKLNRNGIRLCCKGTAKTSGGFIWKNK